VAIKFGFNEQDELQVEGCIMPRNREKFTPTELNTAYLTACSTSKELAEDKPAAQLLQDFVTTPDLKLGETKCQVFTFDQKLFDYEEITQEEVRDLMSNEQTQDIPIFQSFAGKRYKPVALKTRPVYGELPEKYRIKREIVGDPLEGMPTMPSNPGEFIPTGRYTQERKEIIDKSHGENFLWDEERKLMHNFMMMHQDAFAWKDSERGNLRQDFFPPVEIPTVEHEVWVERTIPIPRGQLEEFCKVIKMKIDAGVYEPSNSSYRSKFFGVLKKDGKSIRLVHALEPLNAVTIAHSGLPPATEELANHFAGRACGAVLDLYSGYDHRDLAEGSRDYTTFQTPFGALRIVKLPMGWTNSVPIFHDDVSFVLRDEIPHVSIPYIDDVPVRGPGSRYKKDGDTYETIPQNSGIRRFVWEHFQNLNRVCQRLKYSGLTVSGPKAIICKEEFMVVGHLCTFEGRKPSTDRIGVILRWPPLEDVSQVRQFLGVVGYMRMFLRNYSVITRPLTKLLKADVAFEWTEVEQASMDAVKQALLDCDALKPLNYEWDSDIVLAVDTSWMAIGIEIYQCDPDDPKKRYFAKFDSIPLNEREARFSQPKRELYGLKRALEHMQYWLLGCRKLVVETDAMYIKGMLDNPGMGPNATINRWIEQILMFHFKLRHVRGLVFSPDGLSRRKPQPGDEVYPNPEDGYDEYHSPEMHGDWDHSIPQPYDFEEFKTSIDTRGGYLLGDHGVPETLGTARLYEQFSQECWEAYSGEEDLKRMVVQAYEADKCEMPAYLVDQTKPAEPLLPKMHFKLDPDKRENYPEERRTAAAIRQDQRLWDLREWLKDTSRRPDGYSEKEYAKLVKLAKLFYRGKDGNLFRRSPDGENKLVVPKEDRMFVMKASHDSLGHRGVYATKTLIELRMWWPEMDRDISWYVKTCHMCQVRQRRLLRIPPVLTSTPSIFRRIHVDVMVMGMTSNGHRYLVSARDALSRWLEARGLRAENAVAIGMFLLECIICRWGCPSEIVTDNAKQMKAALNWLEMKWGITGVTISSYNSQANGPVERSHWDVRQSMVKATGGNMRKWFWFLPQVIWADRVTVRRGLGCSPYFAVTGCHPVLPLDLVETTWLVEYPGQVISTAELVGLRARALAKHRRHMGEMRVRVTAEKLRALRRYERVHKATIKDYKFQPGDLVIIRNTRIEKSLNKKAKLRYLGPMIVVRRTKGGSYLLCEMNGAMWHGRVAAFRVLPYLQRTAIEYPKQIEDLIDMSKEELDEAYAKAEEKDAMYGKDLQFEGVGLGSDESDSEDESEGDPEADADEDQDDDAESDHDDQE
jgi:hypothetical protein